VTLAFAYLVIYPKFVGNNVKVMYWLDFPITLIPLGVSAVLFWESDPVFDFFGAEFNWVVFTLVTMLVIELPAFMLYLKARGLWSEYWSMFSPAPKGSPDAGWASASVGSVEKQLNDTRWDGLRTPAAKRILLWAANISILGGTAFLFLVGDSVWASYILIHVLLISIFWFLLRQVVRLVADAPEEALDERLIEVRDRSYLIAYRWLAALVTFVAIALMVFAVVSDFDPTSDGFNYSLSITWPQVQGFFWLLFGYTFMFPSMALIANDLKQSRVKK
jgi:hypothetical protein